MDSQTSAISRSLLALLRPISLSKTCCCSQSSLSLAPVNTFPSIPLPSSNIRPPLPPQLTCQRHNCRPIVLHTALSPSHHTTVHSRCSAVYCRYWFSALRFPYHNFGYSPLRRSRHCRYRPPSTRHSAFARLPRLLSLRPPRVDSPTYEYLFACHPRPCLR